jgi:hypothetical protein
MHQSAADAAGHLSAADAAGHLSAADAAGHLSAADRLVRLLVAGTALVLVLDVVMRTIDRAVGFPAAHWFDVGREHNLPTGWSVLLLVAAGVACVRLARATRAPGWCVAAAVTGYLAADEWFGWQEHLKSVGTRLGDAGGEVSTYAWVLPGAALGAAGAVAAFLWSRRLPAPVRRICRLAVVVYGAGVLGVESVSGWVEAERSWSAWTVLTLCEEGLEMAGAVLFLAGARRAARSEPAGGLQVEVGVRDMGGEPVGRSLRDHHTAPAQRRGDTPPVGIRGLGGSGGVDADGVVTPSP